MPIFKIMYIVHSLGVGGTERLVYKMVRNLKDRGIYSSVCCLDYLGTWGEELLSSGFQVFVLERKTGIDLSISQKIKTIIKREQPDILHAHQYTPYFYTANSVFSFNRPRVVFTEHGRFFPDKVRIKRVIFNQFAQYFTDAIVGVCEFTKDVSLGRYEKFSRNRIKVINNGINPEEFLLGIDVNLKKKSLGLNPEEKIIGVVGRLCEVKNHRLLIRAFAEVRKYINNAKLLIVGDGGLRNELENFSKELTLGDDILFLGERSDIPELMGIFDLFALSSDLEASNLAVLEAMASGLPVVATNVGGNPELVVDGETGILVQRGDDKKFASAVIRILQNPELKKQMGFSGRQRVIERFTFNRMMEEYIALYESLLSEDSK